VPVELAEFIVGVAGIVASLVTLSYWSGKKFEAINRKSEVIDRRFEMFKAKLTTFSDGVKSAVVSTHEALIDLMALKALVTREEANFLAKAVTRLASAVGGNPLSKENLEYIKSVFGREDPDKITIEEAEKAASIAKKWWYEEGKDEAYKIFLAATFVRGYHKSERVRKESEARKKALQSP